MAENTSIEWCDHTWTPVVGCDPISPACANCYAALMATRLEAMGIEKYNGVAVRAGGKGKWTGKVNFSEADLVKPLQVRRPGRWFLTSMGDVAHDAVTPEQIVELFGVMAVAGAYGRFAMPRGHGGPHTFMVLTKRPKRLAMLLRLPTFRRMVGSAARRWAFNRVDMDWLADGITGQNPLRRDAGFWPLPNVMIGCTAEDQQRADELRPSMASIAATGWKTFVSYEPALGPVDWSGWEFLKQLISGGESGTKARPAHPDWHRASRDFAVRNGIAYLFKQWGEWLPINQQDDAFNNRLYRSNRKAALHEDQGALDESYGRTCTVPCGVVHIDGSLHDLLEPMAFRAGAGAMTTFKVGKKAAGRLLDGRSWDGVPA